MSVEVSDVVTVAVVTMTDSSCSSEPASRVVSVSTIQPTANDQTRQCRSAGSA